MLFGVDCNAVENVDVGETIRYVIPLISNESNQDSINIYEIDDGYYIDLRDIALLTRCEYEENNGLISLTHGIRRLEINVETCILNEVGIKSQGKIGLKKLEDFYLCEAVPMLTYLGADCSFNENIGYFQVLMPEITFWEAFLPNYLDYHFNTEEWLGGWNDIKKSLYCDIIIDLIDVTEGHGLYASDEHFEDALYDILEVDVYSYESVQNLVRDETHKLNDFVTSEKFVKVWEQGLEIGKELFEGYADYYMTSKIAIENVNYTYQYLQSNYEVASEIGHRINSNICKQMDLQSIGKNSLSVSALALDTSYNIYKLMCLDADSRTLFSTCLTDEVEEFTGYNIDYLQKITKKISADLETDQSIVSNVIVDEVTEWIYSEIKDKGIEKAVSAFEGGDIYFWVAKVGVLLAEIPLRSSIDAFSDNMDMIWLASVQTDIAELASSYMLVAMGEECCSDANHLEMVKNLMSLYYRTTIAFCENAKASCSEFGNVKTKEQTCEYFEQVSNDMAAYLYRMTNCTVVPIGNYNSLLDGVIKAYDILNFLDYAYIERINNYSFKNEYISYILPQYDGGREIGGIEYSVDGQEMHRYIYEYDESGNIARVTWLNLDGSVWYWYEYDYDNQNNKLRMRYFSSSTEMNYFYVYQYDEEGRCISETRCDPYGTKQLHIENEYNEQNRKTQSIVYNDYSGNMTHWIEYEYDSKGNCTNEIWYRIDGNIEKRVEYMYM